MLHTDEHHLTPIDHTLVSQQITAAKLASVGRASIRELVTLVNRIEEATGQSFIRMEMGVPGLDAPAIGIEAEVEALKLAVIADVADRYNVIVIEDLAYFGMDYREDYATPGMAPYQPTIAG